MRRTIACWIIGLALTGAASLAVGAPDFPKLSGRVVDSAGLMDATSQSRLTRMLAAAEKDTGDQIVVVTLPDLGGMSIENYGYRLGRHWGIGDKHKDNGALLIVAKKEHRIRIEVGYGLEGQLTDAKSSLIIRRVITPAFKEGDYARGLIQGSAAMIKVLGGNPGVETPATDASARSENSRHAPSFWHSFGFFVLMVIMILVFGGGGGRGGRRRGGLLWFIPLPIGGFGGSSGGLGGGGFSGGGGSFGGGGASGGW